MAHRYSTIVRQFPFLGAYPEDGLWNLAFNEELTLEQLNERVSSINRVGIDIRKNLMIFYTNELSQENAVQIPAGMEGTGTVILTGPTLREVLLMTNRQGANPLNIAEYSYNYMDSNTVRTVSVWTEDWCQRMRSEIQRNT